MVYEFCEGGSLKNILQNGSVFNETEAIMVIYQISHALLYLQYASS